MARDIQPLCCVNYSPENNSDREKMAKIPREEFSGENIVFRNMFLLLLLRTAQPNLCNNSDSLTWVHWCTLSKP